MSGTITNLSMNNFTTDYRNGSFVIHGGSSIWPFLLTVFATTFKNANLVKHSLLYNFDFIILQFLKLVFDNYLP